MHSLKRGRIVSGRRAAAGAGDIRNFTFSPAANSRYLSAVLKEEV